MRKRILFKDLPKDILENISFPKDGGWYLDIPRQVTYEEIVAIRVMEYSFRPFREFLQGRVYEYAWPTRV
jgi:hypothetical protein